jgi:hypothetical protein
MLAVMGQGKKDAQKTVGHQNKKGTLRDATLGALR